jgi:hypothetical protein
MRAGAGQHSCRARRPGLLLWALAAGALYAGLESKRHWPMGAAYAWLLLLAGLALAVLLLGWAWRRTWLGIVVSSRNVASLGVFQVIAWSVLLASVILAVGWWNPDGLAGADTAGAPQGTLVGVARQTVATVGTVTGSAMVLANKKRKVPDFAKVSGIAKGRVAAQPAAAAESLLKTLTAAPPPAIDAKDDSLRMGVLATRFSAIAKENLAGKPRKAATPAKAKAHAGATDKDEVEQLLKGIQAWHGQVADPVGELEAIVQGLATTGLGALEEATKLAGEELRARLQTVLQANTLHDMATRRTGALYRNVCPTEARLWEMLEGDEVADDTAKEGTRIQFLLFTLVGLAAFGGLVWYAYHSLAQGAVFVPDTPPGFAELLAASGAGYVLAKVPQRTPVLDK